MQTIHTDLYISESIQGNETKIIKTSIILSYILQKLISTFSYKVNMPQVVLCTNIDKEYLN